MANTFAEKLVCQFLCGKQKLSITSVCSCILLVTYLPHVFIYTFAKLCAIIIKNICCIIYTSNRICHAKLSNKSCSCQRGSMLFIFTFRMVVQWFQLMFISPFYLCHTCMNELLRYVNVIQILPHVTFLLRRDIGSPIIHLLYIMFN